MNFPSTLLTTFGKLFGGTQDLRDSIISVPPTLQLVAEIPSPIKFWTTSGTSSPIRTSFMLNVILSVLNAGGAVSSTVFVVGKGLWDLRFNFSYMVDHAMTSNAIVSLQAQNLFGGTAIQIFSFKNYAAAATAFGQTYSIKLNMEDDFGIRIDIPNNAAGNHDDLVLAVSGQLLG